MKDFNLSKVEAETLAYHYINDVGSMIGIGGVAGRGKGTVDFAVEFGNELCEFTSPSVGN